jgi:hypothetical protein
MAGTWRARWTNLLALLDGGQMSREPRWLDVFREEPPLPTVSSGTQRSSPHVSPHAPEIKVSARSPARSSGFTGAPIARFYIAGVVDPKKDTKTVNMVLQHRVCVDVRTRDGLQMACRCPLLSR